MFIDCSNKSLKIIPCESQKILANILPIWLRCVIPVSMFHPLSQIVAEICSRCVGVVSVCPLKVKHICFFDRTHCVENFLICKNSWIIWPTNCFEMSTMLINSNQSNMAFSAHVRSTSETTKAESNKRAWNVKFYHYFSHYGRMTEIG